MPALRTDEGESPRKSPSCESPRKSPALKSPSHKSKSPPEKPPKGRKSPPGFSLTLPAALKSPPSVTLSFPDSIKSPPAVTLQIPGGEGTSSKVTLQVPGGGGGEGGAPKRKGRVRGMSAVKRFEQEYVSSDFLKDLTDKTSKKGKTKAPMPSVVELFSQVSSLKEEVLVARKNEAKMKHRADDVEQKLKNREFEINDIMRRGLTECMRQEAQMRESIEKLGSDMHLQLALLMYAVEPEEAMMQTVDMSDALKIEELNRLLFEETKRSENLQETVKAMEDAAAEFDNPESPSTSPIHRAIDLDFETQEKLQDLKEEIVNRDSEIGKLV